METYRFKTNIKCGGCIAAVNPHLNGLKGLERWSVDTADPDRILTAEVSGLTPEDVIAAVRKAGYQAQKTD